MQEKSAAGKLEAIFSDLRINPVILALLTRETFGSNTNAIAEDWWYYHTRDITQIIKNPYGTAIDLHLYDKDDA